ncbi:hypothetical protein AVENLUH13518_00572 [Acinetobacter venetianus]|uniref:Uncharacterized protein n=1 Tax=Acinetobacter venetianus TaxID=52133 RepID=A0A150HZ52_9GAMM|nr:hypothetical protein AVENLUH13518_00572 [Acinetobacter venetianus]
MNYLLNFDEKYFEHALNKFVNFIQKGLSIF